MRAVKKITAFLLALVMALSLVTTTFAAEIGQIFTLTFDNKAPHAGDKITATINLDQTPSDYYKVTTTLKYNKDVLTYESYTCSWEGMTCTVTEKNSGDDKSKVFFKIDSNKGKDADIVNKIQTRQTGAFATVTFKVNDSCEVGQAINYTFLGSFYDAKAMAAINNASVTGSLAVTEQGGSIITVPKTPTGYSVSMAADQQVAAGQQVRIPVTVASSEKGITGFNAYDMTFTYDPAALTLNTTSDAAANLTVEDNNGTVRVRRYGDTVALGEALALKFTANKATSSTVTLTAAKFDLDANSINFDAPAAAISDADTTVKALWKVTLPDGFLSTAANGSTLVENGGDFTFKTTDTHYEYYLNITTNGATSIEKMDKATYTIQNVTDNVTVTVDNRIGKTYTIKYVVEDNTTAENKATVDDLVAYSTTTVQYPNDYQFTVKFPGTGYVVWVGIEPYKNNKSYVRQEDGAKLYTLSGASLAGDDNNEITITLTKAKNTSMHKIEVTDSGADAFSESNAKTFYTGENYTFTLNKNDTYYDYSMRVYYERPKSSYGTESIYMEYKDNGDGTYTIIDMPNYDVTIRITKTAKAIDPDAVEVLKYLELDNKTVFMVRVRGALSAYNADGTIRMIGFTYDGQRMYVPSCYKPGTGESYSVYLVILNKGETLTKEEATEKLGVVTSTSQEYRDHYVEVGSDVNEDGIGGVGIDRRDVNDVQLIYDLYNGLYDSFETVSMRKFLKADVNGDYTVNSQDAVKLAGELIV